MHLTNGMPVSPFTKETLTFLRQLKLHNERDWFLAHKADYHAHVQQPMQAMARQMNDYLGRMAPEYALPDPNKALNRIYRDIRFSHDKSPYNTQVSALFTRRGLDKKLGAAAYFALSPTDVTLAGGLYSLDGPHLVQVRTYLSEHHKDMARLLANRKTKAAFGELEGEQLTRVPKGFPADHPAQDLLRRKQWLLRHTWPAAFALTDDFVGEIEQGLIALMPFLQLLNNSFQNVAPHILSKASDSRLGASSLSRKSS